MKENKTENSQTCNCERHKKFESALYQIKSIVDETIFEEEQNPDYPLKDNHSNITSKKANSSSDEELEFVFESIEVLSKNIKRLTLEVELLKTK